MNKSLTREISSAARGGLFAINGILPDPDSILMRHSGGMNVYRELLNDPHVRSCVTSRKSGVLSKGWHIEQHDSSNAAFALVKSVFDSIDTDALISQILNAPLFGYQPLEIIWKVDNSSLIPDRIEPKPQEWFAFTKKGELRLLSSSNLFDGEPVPDMKFLCPRHNATCINPYGEKLLSSIFWAVTFKKGGLKFWVSFVEKYGMPWAIGKLNRQTTEEEAISLRDALNNMVQDGVAVIDKNCDVELKDPATRTASAAVYRELVEFNNDEISKALLGQTLTTQVGSSGSYAAAKAHLCVREDIVQSDIKLVQTTLNTLISWIISLNFRTGERPPAFVICDKNEINTELAQRDEILARIGVAFSKEYFQKTYALNDNDFTIPLQP